MSMVRFAICQGRRSLDRPTTWSSAHVFGDRGDGSGPCAHQALSTLSDRETSSRRHRRPDGLSRVSYNASWEACVRDRARQDCPQVLGWRREATDRDCERIERARSKATRCSCLRRSCGSVRASEPSPHLGGSCTTSSTSGTLGTGGRAAGRFTP